MVRLQLYFGMTFNIMELFNLKRYLTIYIMIILFSAIVLISVVGMALANELQNWLDTKFKKQNSNQENYTAVKT